MTTTRGPSDVRRRLRSHVLNNLPDVIGWLRDEWGDPGAFPQAGVEDGAPEVPDDLDHVQSVMGRPLDRYPLCQIELLSSRTQRGGLEPLDGEDAVTYTTTYSIQAFVFIDVDLPESVELGEEREHATDVRDDLQMALRYVFLERQVGSDPSLLLVLANTYAEDFGEPQPAKGQRWTVGGRARFDVRAQERLSRPSLATVPPTEQVTPDTPAGQVAVDVSVQPLHPALD